MKKVKNEVIKFMQENGIIQCDTSKGIRYLDIESKEIYTEAELMAIIERGENIEQVKGL